MTKTFFLGCSTGVFEAPSGVLSPLSLLVCSLLLFSSCSVPRAGSPPEPQEHHPPGQTALLRERAKTYQEILEERHLSPEGLLVYRRIRPITEQGPWPDLASLPPGSYGNLADGCVWTSCYLASQSFRYATTGSDAALLQVKITLSALQMLTDITGKPGLYGRSFDRGRAEASYEAEHHEWRQGAGRFSAYRYRGDVSKDQIAGLIFGLIVTFELVPDQDVRNSCRLQLLSLADHILDNDLNIVDIDGEPTRFGDLQGTIFGVPLGVNALIALSTLKGAFRATGLPRFEDAYLDLVHQGYIDFSYWAKFELFGKTNHNNDVMGLLSTYSLLSLEEDPVIREGLISSIKRTFRYVGKEKNSLYNGVYCSQVEVDPILLLDAIESLVQFPDDKVAEPLDLRERDELGRSFWHNRKGVPRAAHAIPMKLRVMTSFNWKTCPYALVRGAAADDEVVFSGCDYLLAYWLLRYHRLLPEPESDPERMKAPEKSGE